MDWLDLLAVQGTLKSLLQDHSSKASILQCSTFFIVQISHPYMTTGKTIAWTIQTFVDKEMSLLFNMLSRLLTTFLPRSTRLLISWLQSPSAVILEPRKIKSATVSLFPHLFSGTVNWNKCSGILFDCLFVYTCIYSTPSSLIPVHILYKKNASHVPERLIQCFFFTITPNRKISTKF